MQPYWTANDVDVNGVRLHYTRTGNGEKPPLVLVHGRSDNGLCWAKTAQKLESHYDIIMPDSRGHGLSARLQSGDVLDNAGDLAGLIRALHLDHPIVAGHSMGAASASELGVRFPELPRALILEDPPWRIPHQPADSAREGGAVDPFAERIKTLERKSLDALVAESQPEHPTWDKEVLRTWCLAKQQLDLNFLTVKRKGMNWQEIVRGIACPTLLITADSPGGIVSAETAKQVVEMNDVISHVHISGTGHHIRFENYDDYFAAFIAFLAKIT